MQDLVFPLVDCDFNPGDLFSWVEGVAFIEDCWASLARLTIIDSETNRIGTSPLDPCDGQVSEF